MTCTPLLTPVRSPGTLALYSETRASMSGKPAQSDQTTQPEPAAGDGWGDPISADRQAELVAMLRN